jgi:hypothetical protein
MGLNHSPRIVTAGLVLCLDAANAKSYPGSGTTWIDLSGNGNNGTLFNGVSTNTNNKGNMTFDGIDDWVNVNSTISLVPVNVTISIFIKLNSYSSRPHLIGRGEGSIGHSYFVVESSGVFRFYNDIGSGWGYTQPDSFIFPIDSWVNIVGTFDGSFIKVYSNAKEIASTIRVGNLRQYLNNDTKIGRILTGSNYINGSVGFVQQYNRALSATEIQQNFNAIRGRFGI